METEKEIIRTVYHEDVSEFFEALGLSGKLDRAEIHCVVCGEPITLENFKAAINKSGNLLFCCDKESCIEGFSSYMIGDES